MYHPSRGGVRGGADQFNWEDVKLDKYRENYLGHSVKAPVGRWQKGKDLSWYSKDRNSKEQIEIRKNDMAAIKAAEEEAMLAALGKKPIKKEVQPLSKEDLAEVLQRNPTEREGERTTGIGKNRPTFGCPSNSTKNGVAFQGPNGNKSTDKSQKAEDDNERKSSKSKKKKKKKQHKHKERSRHDSHSSSEDSKRNSSSKRSHSDDSSDRNSSTRTTTKRKRHDSDSSD